MRRYFYCLQTIGALAVLLLGAMPALTQQATGVAECPATQAAEWLRWTIPLPKEAAIPRQMTLLATEVKLTARAGADELELNALRQLQDLFREQAGIFGAGAGAGFEILLGVCDAQGKIGDLAVPDAARLAELPNKEQAYLIRPVGDNRLVLAALDARGVFYAALTLRQLLESKFGGENVMLPLAVITDWPDLPERGEWGSLTKNSPHTRPEDIEILAGYKMNLQWFHTKHLVDKDGKAAASINRALLRRGRLNAVKMVPLISHLNGMDRRGVYTAYPELRGKGAGAVYKVGTRELYAPCASNPKLIGILADWMRGYAAYEGVRDISCWLGELHQRCECAECAKYDQFVLETRAFVAAWRLAVADYPDLRISIGVTQGSFKSNDKVLAEIPPEVGVDYYDGKRTYDSSPTPMIYPLMEEYAANGGRLGCLPQLTPSWRIVSPWSAPQFIKYRMTEFVDKKLTSLVGYAVGGNRLFEFNAMAAAEWSWNAHGRGAREFALAWATRQGMSPANAALAADWAVMLGQAAWDLYGARLVERYFFRPASLAGMVTAGVAPSYGTGLFTYIPDYRHLEQNLQACRTALALAKRVGDARMMGETKAILTYYQIVKELADICEFLAANKTVGALELDALQRHMNRMALAGLLNVGALHDWERSVKAGEGGPRFLEGVQATRDTVAAVARALAKFGVRDPMSALEGADYQPLDWQAQVMNFKPGAVTAAGRQGFSGTGLKVGVIGGGAGAAGLLDFLRKMDGFDAAPVGMNNFQSENCRVVILPQMGFAVPENLARALEEFVRAGGGVITTHDAVGYRSQPKIFESVCAGGVEHTRAGTWKAADAHPVNKGLAVDKALARGYYDQVELAPGPDGVIAAIGEVTGKPVVVAGDFGKGRYVACGLLLGMEHDQFGGGDREAEPMDDEAALLLNAIRWCAEEK